MELVSTRFTSGIADEPKQVRLPITGYADESLLTLEEACVPLMTIVDHLESHIWVAKQNSRVPKDGLTPDESAAIHLYTMEWGRGSKSLYSKLNQTLKASSRTLLRPWFKYLKLFLTALAKLPFTPRQSVWRGVTKNLSGDFPVGSEAIWWSFSSCTISLAVLESDVYLGSTGERTLFSIEAINGKCIQEHSYFGTEDEILLLPGTVLEVQSQLNPAPDLYIIHLKQKYPPTMLLESPFKGANLYPNDNEGKSTQKWFQHQGVIASAILLSTIIILTITLACVFGLRHSTSTMPAECHPRRPKNLSADIFWSFDCSNSNNDLSNNSLYDGVGINNPEYIIPDFSGQMTSSALSLQSIYKQYVNISYFWDLALQSFTISAWIYPIAILNNQAPIFANSYSSESEPSGLICHITSNLTMGFLFDENYMLSNRSIYLSQWQHVAFVFNNQTLTSSIYLDGYLIVQSHVESIVTNYSKHLGSTIGYQMYTESAISKIESYYTGYIDQLYFSFQAKSNSELLNEATLVIAYQFSNQSEIYDDSGPNAIPARGQNVFSDGSNGLVFNTTASYFQSSNFTLLSSQNYSYSVAFWVKTSVDYTQVYDRDGFLAPLIRLSSVINPSSGVEECVSVLALVEGQLMISSNPSTSHILLGYNLILQQDQQYHIAYTYSSSERKFRLYINGQPTNPTHDRPLDNPILRLNGDIPRLNLTLGGPSEGKDASMQYQWLSRVCNWGGTDALKTGLSFIEFNGTMNDVRMYSRILTQTDINDLISQRK